MAEEPTPTIEDRLGGYVTTARTFGIPDIATAYTSMTRAIPSVQEIMDGQSVDRPTAENLRQNLEQAQQNAPELILRRTFRSGLIGDPDALTGPDGLSDGQMEDYLNGDAMTTLNDALTIQCNYDRMVAPVAGNMREWVGTRVIQDTESDPLAVAAMYSVLQRAKRDAVANGVQVNFQAPGADELNAALTPELPGSGREAARIREQRLRAAFGDSEDADCHMQFWSPRIQTRYGLRGPRAERPTAEDVRTRIQYDFTDAASLEQNMNAAREIVAGMNIPDAMAGQVEAMSPIDTAITGVYALHPMSQGFAGEYQERREAWDTIYQQMLRRREQLVTRLMS